MAQSIILGNKTIGKDYPPYLIAEMSGNHNQSLDRALEIVRAAYESGANAVKLQTYTADTMTIDLREGDFYISDKNSLWYGKSLYELYEMAYTPWNWHKPIMDLCKDLGMDCISTPFDESAVDFLEELGVPYYKIASFENTDLPLIKKVAQTGKPIIISTGMASLSDLEELVATCRDNGCNDIILLKCTSSYPATPENSNVRTIPHLAQLFNVQVGLSDHSLGSGVAVASIAMGATVVEKHFTLSRSEGGVDSAFSMEPAEFKNLSEEILKGWQALGVVHYGTSRSEIASTKFKRSIYIVEDIKKGTTLDIKNMRRIRPGGGLKSRYYEQVLGKKAIRDIKKGTPLSLELVDFS